MREIKGVVANFQASSKKQVLLELARQTDELTHTGSDLVFEMLLQRERLGSTGIGHGIAIPHARLPGLDRVYGVFAHLAKPVDFDSVDDEPVDLVFLLLAPENDGADHLKALAKVSRILRDKAVCDRLRNTDSVESTYALLDELDFFDAA